MAIEFLHSDVQFYVSDPVCKIGTVRLEKKKKMKVDVDFETGFTALNPVADLF